MMDEVEEARGHGGGQRRRPAVLERDGRGVEGLRAMLGVARERPVDAGRDDAELARGRAGDAAHGERGFLQDLSLEVFFACMVLTMYDLVSTSGLNERVFFF